MRQCGLVYVLGLDGCRSGWIGCVWPGPGGSPQAIHLSSLRSSDTQVGVDCAVIAVDIPLGLPEVARAGGRECERLARTKLGARRSSVFSAPAKCALTAGTYAEANAANRASGPACKGISRQAYALFPKLIEAENALENSEWLRQRVIEVHPEMCFAGMAGFPAEHSKKTGAGKTERRLLLQKQDFRSLAEFEKDARVLGAKTDDALDACAAAWTAFRYLEKRSECLPAESPTPTYSHRIWF